MFLADYDVISTYRFNEAIVIGNTFKGKFHRKSLQEKMTADNITLSRLFKLAKYICGKAWCMFS